MSKDRNNAIKYRFLREEGDKVRLLLDYDQAAAALCVSKQALRDMVCRGKGPVTTKIGRRTFFTIADLEDFVEAHRQGPVR